MKTTTSELDHQVSDRNLEIRPIATDDEMHSCALIMSTTEPWITLQRGYDASLAIVRDPNRETYVACVDHQIAGFIVLNMSGAFVGYIQSVAVSEGMRGHRVGSRLIEFAECRVFRDAPNVFICVSSFNARARALYERLGYQVVGELKDYIVRGHSEWLLRKSTGPISEFTRQPAQRDNAAGTPARAGSA